MNVDYWYLYMILFIIFILILFRIFSFSIGGSFICFVKIFIGIVVFCVGFFDDNDDEMFEILMMDFDQEFVKQWYLEDFDKFGEGYVFGIVIFNKCGLVEVYFILVYFEVCIDFYFFIFCGYFVNGVIFVFIKFSDDVVSRVVYYFIVYVILEFICLYVLFEINVLSGQNGCQIFEVIDYVINIF